MSKYISPYHVEAPVVATRAGIGGQPQVITQGGAPATGSIVFSANPTDGDTIVLNGVTITFGAAADVDNSTDLDTTGAALKTFLNASVDADLAVATYDYTAGTDTLSISYDTNGIVGNVYTIDTTGLTDAPTSADTALSGGQDTPSIDLSTDQTQIRLTQNVNQAITLPAGIEGQEHSISLLAKGGSGNAVVTGTITGGTSLVFDAANEVAFVKYIGAAWRPVYNTSTLA